MLRLHPAGIQKTHKHNKDLILNFCPRQQRTHEGEEKKKGGQKLQNKRLLSSCKHQPWGKMLTVHYKLYSIAESFSIRTCRRAKTPPKNNVLYTLQLSTGFGTMLLINNKNLIGTVVQTVGTVSANCTQNLQRNILLLNILMIKKKRFTDIFFTSGSRK